MYTSLKFRAATLFAAMLSLAGVSPVLAAGKALPAGAANLQTYVKPDGEGVFALSLSPNIPAPAAPPQALTVLFDTSASQTGAYREKALAALEAMLADLSPQDSVALVAVDLTAAKLTSGFVPPRGDEMQRGLARLRGRAPLGATDMETVLDAAAELQAAPDAGGRLRRVVYIGDGMSPVRMITAERMGRLADRFVKAHAAVISYAIGPQVDLQLLGAVAKHTGGVLLQDSEAMTGRQAAGRLAEAVRGPVFWPTDVELPGALHAAYYRGMPPLRFDRDAVAIGRFDPEQVKQGKPLEVQLDGELLGKPVSLDWRVTPQPPSDDNAFLGELVDFAERDGGLSLPSAGSAALSELRWLVNAQARSLVKLSQQAVATGNLPQAERLADEVGHLDPKNPAVPVIRAAIEKVRRQQGAEGPDNLRLVKQSRAADEEPAEGELLDEVERQERVYQQFLQTEVRNVVNEARRMMGVDPESAIDMLKLTREKVVQAPEVDPELRAQMQDQIEAALRSASTQAIVKQEQEVRQEQIAAEGRARERINRELFLQEQKVDQLMARFNALMDEERYRDAEAVADIAEAMSPNTPGLRDAELTARMVGYTSDMWALRDARHRGVIDSMYQIELSHIPTPDEPPILYPDPEVWQLLTERRKKYKAVDLTQSSPSEAKILAALDDKTELEFVDQPLTDVVEYLKERHGIEIQLDNRALTDEGLGSDTPVTRNLKGISLRSALRLMLGEMDLTYVIENEVLMITTRTEAENMLSTKVYPVADLVVPIRSPMMGGRMGGRGFF